MHPFFVVGNLKMNLLTRAECDKYVSLLKREATGLSFPNVRGIVCPPAIHLAYMTRLPEVLKLGAQNMSWERSGAYTGEISPVMLKDAGVEYVILGHSERRGYFGETDEMVKDKITAALKHNLIPIVCIGETKEERSQDQTTDIIERQVRIAFQGLSPMQVESMILAYEPRWAIGTDVTPTTAEIMQVRVFLRKLLTELYDARLAEKVNMIYGGSVKSTFLASVAWDAEMDGVLVGRESLFPHELLKMMQLFQEHANT